MMDRRRGMAIQEPVIALDIITFTMLVFAICLLLLITIFEPTLGLIQLMFALFGMIYMLSTGAVSKWMSKSFIVSSVTIGLWGGVAIMLLQGILAKVWALQISPRIFLMLIAPVTEEVFFRGFVLNFQIQLLPSQDPLSLSIAFTFNSMLFSVFHIGTALIQQTFTWTYFAIIYISGYVLCFLAWETKGLLAPIMAHFLLNSAIVLRELSKTFIMK